MSYDEVNIGGVIPSYVKPDITIDREARTIKIPCAAIQGILGADPKTEINNLNSLACQKIHNEDLLNGGSKLQASPPNYITATVNDEIFSKCALHLIPTPLDEFYAGDEAGSVIEYEINLEYEVDGGGGSIVYAPDYAEYQELEYHFFFDYLTDTYWNWVGQNKGTEMGYMKFTFPVNRKVKRVEVYGNGDCVGQCWIACQTEDSKQFWHYGEQSDDSVPIQEKLIWDLEEPTNVIVLFSSLHVPNEATSSPHRGINRGCYLAYVRLVFE